MNLKSKFRFESFAKVVDENCTLQNRTLLLNLISTGLSPKEPYVTHGFSDVFIYFHARIATWGSHQQSFYVTCFQ